MYTIQYAKNLCWVDADHTMFDCIVKMEELPEEVPCTIISTDPYAHIQTLWSNGLAGVYGPIAEYVPPAEPVQPQTEGTQTI